MTSTLILQSPSLQQNINIQQTLVVIDSGVKDYQLLLQGIEPGVQILILNQHEDGIAQISQILCQQPIKSLQIIAHGSPGSLQIGNTRLNLDSLHIYQQQLQHWQVTDILIFACEIASKETGQAFLNQLHLVTKANIAASIAKIGNSQLGGSWQLEVQIGQVNSGIALEPQTRENYPFILAIPYLVKDINPGSGNSSPYNLTNINDTLYFRANDGTNGTELWKIDSTGNAVLVKDINPGSAGSSPYNLTNINDTLYFVAYDGTNGTELWKIDSSGNAVLVKDINPGSDNSYPDYLTNINDTLYFRASDGTDGYELWKIDSTGNAVLVKDINPGSVGSNPSNLTNINDTLYFAADDGTNGTELWKIDSSGNAVLVTDINSDSGSSSPSNLTNINDTLYFAANDGTNGTELWKIDSSGNAVLVKDINPGSAGSSPNYLTNINDTLYFTANDGTNGTELWKIDSTGNAVLVKDINPGSAGSSLSLLTNINDTLYFAANDGTNGRELWKIDSSGNAVLVKDINPGSAGSSPYNLTNINDTLYFTANDGTNGFELWKIDSSGNAVLVKDINPGSAGSSPGYITNINDTLYFTADDGTNGTELWALPLNTPPTVATAIADQSATVGSVFNFQFAANTFNDVDTDDTLTYSATLEDGNSLPDWLTFNATTRTFSGTPSTGGTIKIKVTAKDAANAAVDDVFALAINTLTINTPPTVANPIADQSATVGSALNFQFAANTFNDVDTEDTLTYSATLEDGNSLPNWLTFNATTRTFSGTPPTGGTIKIKITAKDAANAAVDDVFALAVNSVQQQQVTELINSTNDIFQINGSQTTTQLKVSLKAHSSQLVNELAVFTVDDDNGTINGITPGTIGYVEAAIARSSVIFSTIAKIPNGFDTNNLTRTLQFTNNQKFRFALIKNNTFDAVKAGSASFANIIFSDASSQKITNLGNNVLSLGWRDGSNNNVSEFNDLVVNLQATDDASPLGTSLQNTSQGEMIDLQDVSGAVSATFSVYREASYDSFVGFYQVTDANGGIDTNSDGVADVLVGQAGYLQAAINQRVADISLTANNQATATYTNSFTGGGIFVPFIIVNGKPDALLDSNSKNDPAVYFSFLGANSDNSDHIRLLGDNVFGFEDLPNLGDKDYNDVIVKIDWNIS